MAIIVDGKKIASLILEKLKKEVFRLGGFGKPRLAVVIVGDNKPSLVYVDKKEAAALDVGINFIKFNFSKNENKENIIGKLKVIQEQESLSGLIIQLPLPKQLEPFTGEIVDSIGLEIDVDCLSRRSLGKVMMGENYLLPPTPSAILEILNFYKVGLKNKNVCLLGRGDLIGKPLMAMLANQPVGLSIHNESTKNIKDYTKIADIIISGVGKKNILTKDMVKDGVIVIDAGICFEKNKICGDVDFDSVSEKASLITKTPGGVGPITVAKLLANVVAVFKRQHSLP